MIKKCIVYFKWIILLYVLMGFLVQFFNTFGIKIFQELLDKVALADNFYDVSSHIFLYSALLFFEEMIKLKQGI
ncbi:hypothetical protein MKY52_21855, partial [Paenibacillus sp. FSL P4-0184]